jgi:hypothetical protein
VRGREDRRPRPRRERDALEAGVIVDDIEPPVDSVAERGLDVREVRMLGVAHPVVVRAVAVATVDRTLETGIGQRVAGRVERDLVAAPDEAVRDETDDELGPTVGVRRDALVGRRELGDAQ